MKKKKFKDPYTVDRDPINDWSKTLRSISKASKKADEKRKNIGLGKKQKKINLHKGITDPLQRQQSIEQEQLIGYWIKDKGLKHSDFVGHRYIDDVILLVNIRDTMWERFSKSDKAVWGAYWDNVYHKGKKLKTKALNKFEQAIVKAQHRLTQQQITRQKIQQIRENQETERRDYDMTAKESRIATAG